MKLIIENAITLDSSIEDELNESSGVTERNYYLSGIFSSPDEKNRNGRVYPRSIWEREVSNYQKEIKDRTINSLSEYQHPPRSTVDPMKAVGRITELGFKDDGKVWGKVKILNDNTDQTNKLKGLIKEGIKIGISTRGVGKVSAAGQVLEYKLITADLVDAPSDMNALLNGVVEGVQIVEGIVQDKEYEILENGCVSECSLETPKKEAIEEKAKDLISYAEEKGYGIGLDGKKGYYITGDKVKGGIQYLDAKTEKEAFEKLAKLNSLSEKSEESTIYKNVDALREILEEQNATKLCDLTLDEKEEVLEKLLNTVQTEQTEQTEQNEQPEQPKQVQEQAEDSFTEEKAKKLIEAFNKSLNKTI